MNTITLYHGAHTKYALHVGQCYTPERDSAEAYALGRGVVAEIELCLDGLRVVELDHGYDRETNDAPADLDPAAAAVEHSADVVIFSDEDDRGREHTTYRLLTPAAVSAITARVM